MGVKKRSFLGGVLLILVIFAVSFSAAQRLEEFPSPTDIDGISAEEAAHDELRLSLLGPLTKTEREKNIKERLTPEEEKKIREGRTERVRPPRKPRIIPDLDRIVAKAQEKKAATEVTKKNVEKAKEDLVEVSKQQVGRLPPALGKRITSRLNIISAGFFSDLYRFGGALGLGSDNVPVLQAVRPNPLDTDQCSVAGCELTLIVSNTHPPFTGDRSVPLSFVLVSVEEPLNQWQYGWSEEYHIINIQTPSPDKITLTIPRSLDRVNRLRVRVVNYIDDNMYTSNRGVVVIAGIPPEPVLNEVRYDALQQSVAVEGNQFFPAYGVAAPGQPHSLLLVGDKVNGLFTNGYSVPFTYQNQQLLLVDPADIAGTQPVVHFVVVNKLDQRFTVSELRRYERGGPGEEEICTNGVDDDGDGDVDCGDSDCDGQHGCEYGQELTCDDGFDNDGDGLVDCNDPDCSAAPACVPPPGGLLGGYAFDEGAGTTVSDSSPYGNDGTNYGASWATPSQCKQGSCLNFDGASDYVGVPDGPSLNPAQELTLAAWVNGDAMNGGVVISKGNTGNQYHLRLFSDKIRFTININVVVERPYTFSAGMWYHVAATYDGNAMKVYVNGQPVGAPQSISVQIQSTDGTGLQIGRRPALNYFDGRIDEVYVFGDALTQQEIQQLMGGPSGPEICTNGIDDDGDGLVDCADPECIGQQGAGGLCQSSELICDDFFDNDGDGRVDCQDPDCFLNPICQVGGGGTDICAGYNTGNINKPSNFPSYHSLLEDSWTWRRPLNPATDIDVGGPYADYTSLQTAFQNANSGDTIIVHALTGAETQALALANKQFANGNPVHIYFATPGTTVGPHPWKSDVFFIDNVKNVVVDGMNNLKIVASTPLLQVTPRAGIFIGSMLWEVYDRVENLVIKNLEVDGGHYGAADRGAKWGVTSDGITNVALCNLYIHNTKDEHGVYNHLTEGNFEVVNSKIDVVGRTCIQTRHSGIGSTTAKFIYANNECTNSCQAGALTAADASGTWWIHGNKVSKSAQFFSSSDSAHPGANTDHSDGHLYIYDNKVLMKDLPIQRAQWGEYCDNLKSIIISDRGGAHYYFGNNILLALAGSNNFFDWEWDAQTTYYNPTTLMTVLEESDNNIFGVGQPQLNGNPNPHFAKWGYQSNTPSQIQTVSQWKTANPAIDKPAFDVHSQFVLGTVNVQTLANQYFP